ncbi:hypothetical protein HEK616_77860 (plasmid) [Streptomyces nigrescens]|uniref:Uncharacterized protein n=1 Tax=Streptomyces nigrescens TaxID=1920 RepID=A0ABM8A716_STRNI|nr:hypothetical protein HEK616_77860 [Streptomyces nigrescens]
MSPELGAGPGPVEELVDAPPAEDVCPRPVVASTPRSLEIDDYTERSVRMAGQAAVRRRVPAPHPATCSSGTWTGNPTTCTTPTEAGAGG